MTETRPPKEGYISFRIHYNSEQKVGFIGFRIVKESNSERWVGITFGKRRRVIDIKRRLDLENLDEDIENN